MDIIPFGCAAKIGHSFFIWGGIFTDLHQRDACQLCLKLLFGSLGLWRQAEQQKNITREMAESSCQDRQTKVVPLRKSPIGTEVFIEYDQRSVVSVIIDGIKVAVLHQIPEGTGAVSTALQPSVLVQSLQ